MDESIINKLKYLNETGLNTADLILIGVKKGENKFKDRWSSFLMGIIDSENKIVPICKIIYVKLDQEFQHLK